MEKKHYYNFCAVFCVLLPSTNAKNMRSMFPAPNFEKSLDAEEMYPTDGGVQHKGILAVAGGFEDSENVSIRQAYRRWDNAYHYRRAYDALLVVYLREDVTDD
jgi:hypothetical protein